MSEKGSLKRYNYSCNDGKFAVFARSYSSASEKIFNCPNCVFANLDSIVLPDETVILMSKDSTPSNFDIL